MAHPSCGFAILAVVALASVSMASRSPQNYAQLEQIEKFTHSSKDPCRDFYGYACGDYAKHNSHQSEYTNVSTMAVESFENTLESIIRQKYHSIKSVPQSGQNFEEKVVAYYYTCMQEEQNWRFWNYLLHVDIKFPLVEAWKNQGYFDENDWAYRFEPFTDMGKLYNYGVRNLPIERDTEKPGFVLKPGNIIPFEPADVERYLRKLDVDSVVLYEYRDQIINIQRLYQYAYNQKSEADNEITSGLDFYGLNSFVREAFPLEANRDFSVTNADYFRSLTNSRVSLEEKRFFSNFLMVTLMHHIDKNYKKDCMKNLREKFGVALNYMYYDEHYLPKARKMNDDISHVIQTIVKTYSNTISENRLGLSPQSVAQIKKYLLETKINVGNLPENVNFNIVNDYYYHLPDFSLENFYFNDLALMAHRNSEAEICKAEFKMVCDSSITEPAYHKTEGVLAIPFIWLQSPLYDSEWDPVFKFSTLGYEVAKGLTHAVGPKMLETLDGVELLGLTVILGAALECYELRDEFEDMPLDIYASEGAEIAFKAYTEAYRHQPDFSNIPAPQLFFRNFAQIYCTTNEVKSLNAMPTDWQRARLNTLIRDMEHFGSAFQCAQGSRMTKSNYCTFY